MATAEHCASVAEYIAFEPECDSRVTACSLMEHVIVDIRDQSALRVFPAREYVRTAPRLTRKLYSASLLSSRGIAMIVVHHLNNSRSQRVLWLLEELGLDYELQLYQRDPKTMLAPPALRRIHPLGKSPIITDGSLTLAESGAIIEYLVDKYGNGRLSPARGTPEYTRYVYWLHYAEGSAMPPLLMKLVFDRLAKAPMPFFARPIAKSIVAGALRTFVEPSLKLHLDYLEGELVNSDWFAGQEFTAADVQMSFPLEAAAMRAGLDGSRPGLHNFLQRIHVRPAYQRALQRGGKYDFVR